MRNRATAKLKRVGWELAVRIEKILCTVIHKAHKLYQVEETMQTLYEGPEGFYGWGITAAATSPLTAPCNDGVGSFFIVDHSCFIRRATWEDR